MAITKPVIDLSNPILIKRCLTYKEVPILIKIHLHANEHSRALHEICPKTFDSGKKIFEIVT